MPDREKNGLLERGALVTAQGSGIVESGMSGRTHGGDRLLRRAAGEDSAVRIFGDDYPTPDGTCIRDYIHVADLSQAHLLALQYLNGHAGAHVFNLGNGTGYSVREVVSAVERVIGRSLNVETASRRPGDPARLVASSERARRELGWQPRIAELEQIVESAWRWHQKPAY